MGSDISTARGCYHVFVGCIIIRVPPVGPIDDMCSVSRNSFYFFAGIQADKGFATSGLCTDEDGTRYFSRYIFYMVRIGTSKKGGNAPRATDKKSM